MNRKKFQSITLLLLIIIGLFSISATIAKPSTSNRVIIKVKSKITPEIIEEISEYAQRIEYVYEEIEAVAITVKKGDLPKLKKLKFVDFIEADNERYAVGGHETGLWTWNLDMINVADYGVPRTVEETGDGVYVAVLDTGLVKHWRDYFFEESIATEYAKCFLSATGKEVRGNAWERDTNSHGTHVTSTIIGYWLSGTSIGGVAPDTKIIPVKVLGNSGFGWDSAIIRGILYIAGLSDGNLENGEVDGPVIISMSLGGPMPSALELSAIQYAISQDVIIVAAAGNSGNAGMDWPGAYEEVISVGACGWTMEWIGDGVGSWWMDDVPEDLFTSDMLGNELQVYITDFSGREKTDQYLDIVAPGSWVVGPYMPYGVAHPPEWSHSVPGEYYYLGGTSMATPHVSGVVALMLEKNPALTAIQTEAILESTALYIPTPNAVTIVNPFTGDFESVSWDADSTGYGLVQADIAINLTPP